ncbi:hypothetical protein [Lacinutrix sp. Hel_I_90]|uniref:hypothetical protein n=1 Tax=Lacinutrix sp. Hel_I_90 TaxID=1249999 RepID=UPI0005C7F3A4|nr:hypothetical protein [Lacinutrix sp. Hel_I_90]
MNIKFLFFFLTISLSVFAQKREQRIDKEFPTPIAFPYDYFGQYSGNLRISNNTGVLANVPTEFSISKSEKEGEFDYSLVFIEGKKKKVNLYKIFTIDQEQGFYAIKSGDGLEFTATLIDNTLFSTYEINDNIISSILEFTNSGKVRLQIILSTKVKNKKTKNLKEDQAKYANVKQIQKAVLNKIAF